MYSVIQQTYKDLQIILIDDGSTDGSDLIMKEFAAMDQRVITVSQNNRGVSAARNKGLSLASGKFILFLDADDYLEPDALESAYRKLCKQSLDFVSAGNFQPHFSFKSLTLYVPTTQ